MILNIENVHYQLKQRNAKDILVYLNVVLKIAVVAIGGVIKMIDKILGYLKDKITIMQCKRYCKKYHNRDLRKWYNANT